MRRLGLFVVGVVIGVLLGWLAFAAAQIVAPLPCGQSAACLRYRVKDLQDYRDFVEDQLALAKSLNESLTAQLAACRASQEGRPRDPLTP
jgi:hypothetical protein